MKHELRLASQDRTVKFRAVTVQDALDLSAISQQQEERATTWWLNTLQDEETFYDSLEWSQEDRTLGLLFLFFLNQETVDRGVSYECSVCGENHRFNADYSELARKDVKTLDEWPTVELNGGYKLQPLRGRDLEAIESMRLEDPNNETRLKLAAVAARLSTTPETLAKLDLGVYISLLKEADDKLSELRHGVDLVVEHPCPIGGGKTRLILPFQANDFIPRI